jgi:hypothetical protein
VRIRTVAAARHQIQKGPIGILVAPVYATVVDCIGEIRSRDMSFVGLGDAAGMTVLRPSGNALRLNFADEFNQPQAALNRKSTLQAAVRRVKLPPELDITLYV